MLQTPTLRPLAAGPDQGLFEAPYTRRTDVNTTISFLVQ